MNKHLPLDFNDIKNLKDDEKIKALEAAVKYHNNKYFIENLPEISDEEFDKITEELKRLDPYSPVLYEIVGEIGEVIHPEPMLSLDKVYSYEDVQKWVKEIYDETFIIEPKYDGMAARYQNNSLTTRGNGIKGEDISSRLKYLNIIGELPTDNQTWIYGEVIIPLTYFNEHLSSLYKNPRNAVVGIVKSKILNSFGLKALLEGGVHFVIYDKAKSSKYTKDEILNKDKWEEIVEDILHQDYPLDGLVIKSTNKELREKLGRTQHHYKSDIAYKMPAERKWSKVTAINNQVGRIGRLTSVAVINPIQLSGATVTNVTLHNPDYVRTSKIGIGSKVEVTRSGEVIPYITQVINEDPNIIPHQLPKNCPICNTKLKEEGKYLICPNPSCPSRLSQSIEYFFKVLEVKELGQKTIERFINEFKLSSIIEFYKLDKDKISTLDGFGTKSAEKIISNIKRTLDKSITPIQLLHALGIKDIGRASSNWILNNYGFEKLPTLTEEELVQVGGIGPVKAKYFLNEIKDKWNIIRELQAIGLKFKEESASDKLKGLKFCITGSFGTYKREDLISLIEINGGDYKSSITKDLDYLIAGDNAGSKLEKVSASTQIIDLDKFLSLVKG
jgi:DNA ligase (NAD+)